MLPINLNNVTQAVPGYVWGRHFKAYLAHRNRNTDLAPRKLMEALGRQNVAKVQRRRQEWIEGRGRIPLRFLDLICVDCSILQDAVKLDRKEYRAALASCPIPERVAIKWVPGVWVNLDVPDDIQDRHALQHFVESVARELGRDVCANFSGLKTLYTTAAGKTFTTQFPPGFDVEPPYLTFWQRGSRTGTTCIA